MIKEMQEALSQLVTQSRMLVYRPTFSLALLLYKIGCPSQQRQTSPSATTSNIVPPIERGK